MMAVGAASMMARSTSRDSRRSFSVRSWPVISRATPSMRRMRPTASRMGIRVVLNERVPRGSDEFLVVGDDGACLQAATVVRGDLPSELGGDRLLDESAADLRGRIPHRPLVGRVDLREPEATLRRDVEHEDAVGNILEHLSVPKRAISNGIAGLLEVPGACQRADDEGDLARLVAHRVEQQRPRTSLACRSRWPRRT